MAAITNQDRVDVLIQSFWKNGYLTLSRKFGTYLPNPEPIGSYEIDAVGKQRKKFVIGLTIKEEELNNPKIYEKIKFLASRHSKYSKNKVSLFIGVNKKLVNKVRLLISGMDETIRKNIKIVPIVNNNYN